jgi:murein DD-endopeptidase MepM/ murein hydrolase activator NlpD
LFGMRRMAGAATLTVAAAIVLVAAPTGASACGGSGGTSIRPHHCRSGGAYVNPFKGQRWYAGRIDMGVDYMARRREPVRAIGRAKVLGADRHSGWPGGHFIWYKLLRGDHRGDIIYVAETLKHLVPRGTTVPAGHRIATALPGGTGTEWGWATRSGQARAAPCYHEGMRTNSGKQMARFLLSLGADVGDRVRRRGSDEPSGRRC